MGRCGPQGVNGNLCVTLLMCGKSNAAAAARVAVALMRLGQGNFSNVEGVGRVQAPQGR